MEEATQIPKPNAPDPLEHIWVKMDAGKFDEVISDAQSYFQSSDTALAYEAKKLTGLAWFQLNNYTEAERVFEEICATSYSPDDFFNLTTSATMSGSFDKAKTAIGKAEELIKSGKPSNVSIPNMRLYYMYALRDKEQWEAAFEQLQWLGHVYTGLRITDTTFLYMRGVPFMERTMEAGVEVLEHIPAEKARQFIRTMIEGVDEEGKAFLAELEKTIHYGV